MLSDRIRVLIVDDEPLARALIRTMLERHSDFTLIGECGNGLDAVHMIQNEQPDLVFLDVEMPQLDGLSVVSRVGPSGMPCFIFVTAYDQFALKAFDLDALDYLLKPFDEERFTKALERARKHILKENLPETAAEAESQPANYSDRLLIGANGRLFFLRPDEIDWVEAQGNYIAIHSGQQNYLVRQTLSSIEKQLDPRKFQRIQRSVIVNLDAIRELQPLARGDYEVMLKTGQRLRMSHRFRSAMRQFSLVSF